MGEIERLHNEAVSRGELMYRDPETALWVMTALALRQRGTCCGQGCRHCPYVGTPQVHPERKRTST